jgi:hypothetical protein
MDKVDLLGCEKQVMGSGNLHLMPRPQCPLALEARAQLNTSITSNQSFFLFFLWHYDPTAGPSQSYHSHGALSSGPEKARVECERVSLFTTARSGMHAGPFPSNPTAAERGSEGKEEVREIGEVD